MDYELYHDESMVDGYWHGMLLVPSYTKDKLLNLLQSTRESINYFEELSIKKIRKENSRKFILGNIWVQIGVASLLQKFNNKKYPIFLGRNQNGKKVYDFFEDLIYCKFILFRERDNHKRMLHHIDYGSKIETTFRMGMKGGLHFLGNEKNTIKIIKIHFDGSEHYQRNLDKERIINRITDLRHYCSIDENNDLIDDRSSKHNSVNSQPYEDCQILQLTDLLVGSFRAILGRNSKYIHIKLAYPAKVLINGYKKGYVRMRNSRWNEGLCISQCYLEEDKWIFDKIDYKSSDYKEQYKLF